MFALPDWRFLTAFGGGSMVCPAVPTAKTAYVLAGAYQVEEATVASTVTVLVWQNVPG